MEKFTSSIQAILGNKLWECIPLHRLEAGLSGNKKSHKSLICSFLSVRWPFLSSRFCGETGLWTFSTQVPYLQGYNNVNFTLSNVLVTEVCLIQSHIVFMVSVHLNNTKITNKFVTTNLFVIFVTLMSLCNLVFQNSIVYFHVLLIPSACLDV